MIFEIQGNTARQQVRISLLAHMLPLEKLFARTVSSALVAEWVRCAELLLSGSHELTAVSLSVSEGSPGLKKSFEALYRRTAVIFSELAWRSAGLKGVMEAEFWREQDLWIKKNAAAKVVNVDLATRLALRKAIRKGMEAGEVPAKIAKRLQAAGSFDSKRRAIVIARTETHSASVHAMDKAMKATRIEMWKIWVAAKDTRTRPAHRAANGQKRLLTEPFDVGGEKLMNPGDPRGSPANVIQCFVPETEVCGSFIAGMRSKYAGEILVISTMDGRRLTVTPNHPILTDRGLLFAKNICCGTNLIGYSGDMNCTFPHRLFRSDDEKIPSRIEDIFNSFRSAGSLTNREVISNDFHGDALGIQGNIDIVSPKGELLLDRETLFGQKSGQDSFMFSAMSSMMEPTYGVVDPMFNGLSSAEGTLPGSRTLTLDKSSVFLESDPFQSFSFRAPANGDPEFLESFREHCSIDMKSGGKTLHAATRQIEFGDFIDIWDLDSPETGGLKAFSNRDIPIFESSYQYLLSDPMFLGNLFQRGAGLVQLDKVIEIRNINFSGHVFDLQSEFGWIIADGIFTSNCRCVVTYARVAK